MRILLLHSRYLSGPVSGENRVVDDEAALLRDAGHEVALVQPSMEGVGGAGLLRAGAEVVWSPRATAMVRNAIASFGPDVVHVHNLFPALSPAVLRTAARAGVPIVMTLHNYRLLCLPAVLYRDGKVCEDCVGGSVLPGVRHACYRGSKGASAALAASYTLHRGIDTYDRVDRFIAVSDFVLDKHVQAGFDPSRFVVKPNFTGPMPRREGPGDRFVFLGRVTDGKGVDTLVEAWRSIDMPLDVVGGGPDEERMKVGAPSSVNFVGEVTADDVPGILRDARALLAPSIWYEAAPRVIVEAYAAGVPVIASDGGAMASFIDEDVTGYTATPGDPEAWVRAAQRLLDDDVSTRLGEGAYRAWSEHYTPEASVRALEAIYASVANLPTA